MSDLFEAPRLFIINAGSIARLQIGGELDLATVGALRDHLDLMVESGTGDVELDMELVTFWDATALSALVGAYHQLAAGDRTLRIVGASARVVRLVQLTGLDMLLSPAVLTRVEIPSGPTAEMRRVQRDRRGDRDREGGLDADRQTHARAHR